MSTSSRRSSRRATVVSTLSTLSSTSPNSSTASPATTPTKNTEIVKEVTPGQSLLYLECEEDGLSTPQKSFHAKRLKNFQDQMVKLENLAKAGARIQPQKDGSVIFRTTETTTTTSGPIPVGQVSQTGLTQHQPGVKLLMDPKTGRILGTISSNNQVSSPSVASVVKNPVLPAARMPGASQLPPRTPQSRTTPTRPVSSPATIDFARSQSTSASGTSARNKNFPSLFMQPKPQKAPAAGNSRRPELDAKVKGLLVLSGAKFTEWLIQQGLVPVEQCEVVPGKGKSKLKLGMCSDQKKFPHSGGYVWISEASQNKFTSVFRGSIFEATNHDPVVVLKLIYHWTCQTNISNVMTWVKVDQATIDLYYRLFRGVCMATVQDEILNMGGSGKTVEIGVISLGTTTADGNKREVRVEVLGVLDRTTGLLRLRATEPVVGATQAERFARIFEPMPTWVQKNTKIVTDYSVDKERLHKLGYASVVQCSSQAKRTDGTNTQIMDYLKSIVPKMFQNSLSLLTTSVIQQFLDELTFRECFGHYPLLCFDTFIQRLAAQTAACSQTPVQLVSKLKSATENPFQDWRHSLPQSESRNESSKRSSSDSEKDIDQQISKKFKVASELVDLESYYYATLQGDVEVLMSEFKADMAFKCHLCKKVYMNNIEFMKHLSLHVETDRASAVDLADLCQCKYCYKDFETPYAMQSHLEEVHLKKGSEFLCRICEEGFQAKNHLIYHMTKSHICSELPYFCHICGFRSSLHRDIIDHFQECHDRTDKLQCPRCLKTFSLCSDKGYNSTIAHSFVSHLQQHKDKKVNCKKCCLIFHNEQSLKSHVDKDHVSFKGFDNLEVYQYGANEEPIKMPKPDERNSRLAAKKSGLVKPHHQQAAFAAQNLEDLVMYDLDRDDNCGECGKKVSTPGHYTAYLCCTKCRYSTCCSKAISVHVAIFHGSNPQPVFSLGSPVILESEMFCCCGFKTDSGNKLAKHLATHNCKTAYPDADSATKAIRSLTSASFAPLVSLDEGDTIDPSVAMAKAYCKQKDGKRDEDRKTNEGPLAFLGLQRKSVDDKEESDNERETPEVSRDSMTETFDEKSQEVDNDEKDKGVEKPEEQEISDDAAAHIAEQVVETSQDGNEPMTATESDVVASVEEEHKAEDETPSADGPSETEGQAETEVTDSTHEVEATEAQELKESPVEEVGQQVVDEAEEQLSNTERVAEPTEATPDEPVVESIESQEVSAEQNLTEPLLCTTPGVAPMDVDEVSEAMDADECPESSDIEAAVNEAISGIVENQTSSDLPMETD